MRYNLIRVYSDICIRKGKVTYAYIIVHANQVVKKDCGYLDTSHKHSIYYELVATILALKSTPECGSIDVFSDVRDIRSINRRWKNSTKTSRKKLHKCSLMLAKITNDMLEKGTSVRFNYLSKKLKSLSNHGLWYGLCHRAAYRASKIQRKNRNVWIDSKGRDFDFKSLES